MTTPEQFAALLDAYGLAMVNGHFYHSEQDRLERIERISKARTAVLDAYAQALNWAGQLRGERNDLQSKLNHMTDDRDSYAQARAGGAVKVPDAHNDHGQNAYVAGWNACRAEVLRLNHPPAKAATDEITEKVTRAKLDNAAYQRGYADAINHTPDADAADGPLSELELDLALKLGEAVQEIHTLRRSAEAATWQPIETAPKDGLVLLVTSYGHVRVEHWGPYSKYNSPRFTHWMPLPEPPRAALSGRKEGS